METIVVKCQTCQGTGLVRPRDVKTVAYRCDQCHGRGCHVIRFERFEKRERLKGIKTVREFDLGGEIRVKPAEFYAEKILIRNMARCKLCNDVIESTHRHDFVTCSCGKVSVDGGTDYVKRSFEKMDDFEDLSQFA